MATAAAGPCRLAPGRPVAVPGTLRQPLRRPTIAAAGVARACAARPLRERRLVLRMDWPVLAGLRIACRGGRTDRPRGQPPSYGSAGADRHWGRPRCVPRLRRWAPAVPADLSAQRRASPSRRASASCHKAPSPSATRFARRGLRLRSRGRPRPLEPSSSTGRRPDTGSTGESAVGILAAMVGNLQLATTRPPAARGPARPGETSGSPSADPTCAGRPHAQRRLATVRPATPHRSRPPPRHGVNPCANFSVNPHGMPCVWRNRPATGDYGAVDRPPSKCDAPPSHPDPPGSGGAHRPTLDPGPFLLQISTPMV